jgi:hypothetical protein
MSNKNLRKELLRHFKSVKVKYDRVVFNNFFKHYNECANTDGLDLTKKKDKQDFDWLATALCLAFEEHDWLATALCLAFEEHERLVK